MLRSDHNVNFKLSGSWDCGMGCQAVLPAGDPCKACGSLWGRNMDLMLRRISSGCFSGVIEESLSGAGEESRTDSLWQQRTFLYRQHINNNLLPLNLINPF